MGRGRFRRARDAHNAAAAAPAEGLQRQIFRVVLLIGLLSLLVITVCRWGTEALHEDPSDGEGSVYLSGKTSTPNGVSLTE